MQDCTKLPVQEDDTELANHFSVFDETIRSELDSSSSMLVGEINMVNGQRNDTVHGGSYFK